MWRFDAARSANAPQAPAENLHAAWVCKLPALKPAWQDPPNRDRMPYDRCYEPIVVGHRLIFGSSRDDLVRALDTRTGRELWQFRCDGPVRLPPAAAGGRVFVVSDDGFLYALDAKSGALLFKHRGGPDGRRVLGNRRLISCWPARGGPVTDGTTVYYAAGIWPFMGTFLYALDARTGAVRWENSSLGSRYLSQPHNGAAGFGGLAPQGALALVGGTLLVPGGRSVPAAIDAADGHLRYFHLAGSRVQGIGSGMNRKLEGGSDLAATNGFYLNHRGLATALYDIKTGDGYLTWRGTVYPVLDGHRLFLSGKTIRAFDLDDLKKVIARPRFSRRRLITFRHWELSPLWTCNVDATSALIKTGNRLYAAAGSRIAAVELHGNGPPTGVTWTGKVDGTVDRLLCGDDRLFAVTAQGSIYAFGPGPQAPVKRVSAGNPPTAAAAPASPLVSALLGHMSLADGFCVIYGMRTPRRAEAVLAGSKLRVIGVSDSKETVAALRRYFEARGQYGTRISIHEGTPESFRGPPYLAVLSIVASFPTSASPGKVLAAVCRGTRPYGGIVCCPAAAGVGGKAILRALTACATGQWHVQKLGGADCLVREGALPGSADWSDLYGDIANSAKSNDDLVRAPLGLLWFGMNGNADVLPRHGHGPSEQVVGGRLFIEGINVLSARDVYTGLVLWRHEFANLGTFGIYYDKSYRANPLDTSYNQRHLAGANARGTNYVVTPDAVYMAAGAKCLVLDPRTGKTVRTIALPRSASGKMPHEWGFIGVYRDLLIGGTGFARCSGKFDLRRTGWTEEADCSASAGLAVFDRHTGKLLWQRPARLSFVHNAIVAGRGLLYCIDRLPASIEAALQRRGAEAPEPSRLLAFDIRTGTVKWETDKDVFGTWLGYSRDHGFLLECGRHSRDMLPGEPTDRMILMRGEDGTVIWDRHIRQDGPPMIFSDKIVLPAGGNAGTAIDLVSGRQRLYRDPVTGKEIPWTYQRTYGCSSVLASDHLLTFRSGTAAYYDLQEDCGTANLGGFKSGCTSNLIAADGVLNAPDYTRTCTCAYQNQTSVALVYMPDAEAWTASRMPLGNGPILDLGLNLGAPGDHKDSGGTLWFDFPSVGGPSPELPVSMVPEKPTVLTANSSTTAGELPWVGASAVVGLRTLIVHCRHGDDEGAQRTVPYTVRLVFAEPVATPGQRVFDVSLQGRTVLSRLDVAREAGLRHTLVRTFRGIAVGDDLRLDLTPAPGSARPPILSGIALKRED